MSILVIILDFEHTGYYWDFEYPGGNLLDKPVSRVIESRILSLRHYRSIRTQRHVNAVYWFLIATERVCTLETETVL